MNDIETRNDIEILMSSFYSKALVDDTIGFFFTEVVPLQMETHMPLIVDFWETVVLGKAKYKGNVLEVHQHIHQLSTFKEVHFSRWVTLFQQTVNELFSGNNSELIKQRAESIATIMRIKLLHSGIG
ncbi:MAG: group III truncated hemoglobin [Sediminibacterium sp.]